MSRCTLIFVALLLCSTGLTAQEGTSQKIDGVEAQKKVQNPSFKTQIESVLVYPTCARVTRKADISVQKGLQIVELTDVPQSLINSSVTVESRSPGIKVTSVSVKMRYTDLSNPTEYDKAHADYKASQRKVTELQNLIRQKNNEVQRLKSIEPVIPPRGMNPKPYTFADKPAQDLMNFVQAQLLKELSALDSARHDFKAAELDLSVAQNKLNKLSSYVKKSEKVVEVKLESTQNGPVNLQLSYMVNQASWNPSYDIRVNQETKEIKFISYGIVTQKTGEDWDKVPVALSTAMPMQSADLPEFRKIIIGEQYFESPQIMDEKPRRSHNVRYAEKGTFKKMGKRENMNGEQQMIEDNAYGYNDIYVSNKVLRGNRLVRQNGNLYFEDEQGITQSIALNEIQSVRQNYVQMEKNDIPLHRLRMPSEQLRGLDYRYQLARPEKIIANGEYHKYLINTENYQGDFYYQLTPSINNHAYQMITLNNPKIRPILAGPANIFYGTDFIGVIDVPFIIKNGKINIPLGVDQRVKVKREQNNQIQTVGTFSSSKQNNVDIKVTITNNTPAPIQIRSIEAIPVSSKKEITISDIRFEPETLPRKFNPAIGEWKETIDAGVTTVLSAKYTINYPDKYVIEEKNMSNNKLNIIKK